MEMLERSAVRRRVVPFSVECYHKLRDLGMVPVKTELLNGVVIEKMTKSPMHTLLAHRLFGCLAVDLPSGYQLRKEDPLTLATSEPEPDIAIVPGAIETYRFKRPFGSSSFGPDTVFIVLVPLFACQLRLGA